MNELPEEILKTIFSFASYRAYYNLSLVSSNSNELFDKEYIKLTKKYFHDLELVKQNEHILKFVSWYDREMCLIAVKRYGYALEFIEKQDKEMCLLAVTDSGCALEYSKIQDEEICMAAIRQNARALKYVKDPYIEFCLKADL